MNTNPNPGSMKQSERRTTAGDWATVVIIIGGFIMGGIALIYWIWPLFWSGVAVVVVGVGLGRAVNIMEAVSVYSAPYEEDATLHPADRPSSRVRKVR